jgi:hypothetical protein
LFCMLRMLPVSTASRNASRNLSGTSGATRVLRYVFKSVGSFRPGTSTRQRTCCRASSDWIQHPNIRKAFTARPAGTGYNTQTFAKQSLQGQQGLDTWKPTTQATQATHGGGTAWRQIQEELTWHGDYQTDATMPCEHLLDMSPYSILLERPGVACVDSHLIVD